MFHPRIRDQDMEFRKVLALRGPNVWAHSPVIEAWVDLGRWKNSPSDSIPGFNERLMTWLPSMVEHRCSIGERGGFFERLRTGTYFAHILEHIALELQTLAGVDVGYGRARETSEEGVYKVVFKYKDETLAREALKVSREVVLAAAENRTIDIQAEVKRLREIAEDSMLGPSTRSIVDAAKARRIPSSRLDKYSLVQLGHGSKQRRIRAAETDQTGAIAQSIAQDKDLTRKLLQSAGVPTPVGFPVASAADAWETATDWVGLPVVVKPQDGNQGKGVTTNLTTQEAVFKAYEAARAISESVIVEKYAPGDDYRLLVIGGRLIAASRRDPAHVIGDGEHTVRELVAVKNLDPRRSEGHSNVLSKIVIDTIAEQILTFQGFTPDSVPAKGVKVLIRRNANLSTGGTATDVTDIIHPEVAARAIEAAKVVGLDIAGIDVIATDITKPLEEQGGVIVEVNAAPGLRMHLAPSEGKPRNVGEAITDMLFPPGNNGRIPIAAVTGTNGKTTVTRFLTHVLRGTGKTVGMTCTDGIYINDRRIDSDDCSGPVSAGMVLMNPEVDAAVFETARGGILRAGLGFDECQIAIVTNIEEGDHLGLQDIHTPADLARVKRCIVEAVSRDGTAVLNAADPLVAAMAAHCVGRVLFFACEEDNEVLVSHRANGGRAIFVRNGTVVLAEGFDEKALIKVDRIPMTMNGQIRFEVENALAVLGAAWCMDIDVDTIVRQAACFGSDESKVPGRFNVISLRGGTVIVDYGHNVPALRAMIQAMDVFPHRRRTALYTMAGDRRDDDIERIGELLGDAFDSVVIYETVTARGRKPGETGGVLRQGLEKGRRVGSVVEIEDPKKATSFVLDQVGPGDLLLLQADAIDTTMEWVAEYMSGLRALELAAVS